MDARPPQPPEGKLIADALKASGLSIREASRRARISYGRWRQITTGRQNVSPGSWAAVRAPADTLARMARVVGLTPEQVEDQGGRPDAAEVMRTAPSEPEPAAPPRLALVPSSVTPDARLFALERIASLIPDASEAQLGVLEKLAEVAAAGDETLELAYRMPDPDREGRLLPLAVRVALMVARLLERAHLAQEGPPEAARMPERAAGDREDDRREPRDGPDILPEGMREFVHDAARGPQDEARLIAVFEAQARGEPLPRFRKRRAAR